MKAFSKQGKVAHSYLIFGRILYLFGIAVMIVGTIGVILTSLQSYDDIDHQGMLVLESYTKGSSPEPREYIYFARGASSLIMLSVILAPFGVVVGCLSILVGSVASGDNKLAVASFLMVALLAYAFLCIF